MSQDPAALSAALEALRAERDALVAERDGLRAEMRANDKRARTAERKARQWERIAHTSESLSDTSRKAMLQTRTALEESVKELEAARIAAEHAAEAKGRFLAIMSHELRTPLNGVLGTLELLCDQELVGEAHELAHTAWDSARALLAIINDILDYSKLEAGAMRVESIPVNLRSLSQACVQMMRGNAYNKGLELTLEVQDDVPDALATDPTRIRQILLNLLGNALKFTECGRVTTTLSYASGRLRVEVHDTGIGIAKNRVERLFELFTQADESTQRRYGGTGLGLAICQRLVEVMEGEIGVASTPGEGSTFWFELPMEPVEPSRLEETNSALDEASWSFDITRVLVVDDNPVNRMVAARMLSGLGLTVALAEGGAQAVREVMGSDFDVVFMDCFMPDIDGYEATRLIRQAEDRGKAQIPIIAMTAFTGDDAREACIAAGMDDHVVKPVQRRDLVHAIQRLSSGHRSRRAMG